MFQEKLRIIVVALDISQNSFDVWSKNANSSLIPQQSRDNYISATEITNIQFDSFDQSETTTCHQYAWLDFALFDAEKDSNIKLTHSKIEISSETPSLNPIITICNYLFDRYVYFIHFLYLDLTWIFQIF